MTNSYRIIWRGSVEDTPPSFQYLLTWGHMNFFINEVFLLVFFSSIQLSYSPFSLCPSLLYNSVIRLSLCVPLFYTIQLFAFLSVFLSSIQLSYSPFSLSVLLFYTTQLFSFLSVFLSSIQLSYSPFYLCYIFTLYFYFRSYLIL